MPSAESRHTGVTVSRRVLVATVLAVLAGLLGMHVLSSHGSGHGSGNGSGHHPVGMAGVSVVGAASTQPQQLGALTGSGGQGSGTRSLAGLCLWVLSALLLALLWRRTGARDPVLWSVDRPVAARVPARRRSRPPPSLVDLSICRC
ncbi:MAG: DUF6153 family protein [Nocardioidaceae bacterium]